jgi:hypothetical protein
VFGRSIAQTSAAVRAADVARRAAVDEALARGDFASARIAIDSLEKHVVKANDDATYVSSLLDCRVPADGSNSKDLMN